MAAIGVVGGISLALAAASAAATTAGTVMSANAASDAATRAKKSRDKQAAIQNRAIREEDYQRDRDRRRKRAADIQSEREATLASGAWGQGAGVGGTILGNPGSSNTTLGA